MRLSDNNDQKTGQKQTTVESRKKMISSISSISWREPTKRMNENENIEDQSSDEDEWVVAGPSCKAPHSPDTAQD